MFIVYTVRRSFVLLVFPLVILECERERETSSCMRNTIYNAYSPEKGHNNAYSQ